MDAVCGQASPTACRSRIAAHRIPPAGLSPEIRIEGRLNEIQRLCSAASTAGVRSERADRASPVHRVGHRRFFDRLHRAVRDRFGAGGEPDWSAAPVDSATVRIEPGRRSLAGHSRIAHRIGAAPPSQSTSPGTLSSRIPGGKTDRPGARPAATSPVRCSRAPPRPRSRCARGGAVRAVGCTRVTAAAGLRHGSGCRVRGRPAVD